jgi:ABC-2 type transport system ATP-binding protein
LENAVAVSGLTKYYNNIPVVDHVSFNVRVGEIFGFLGPNGAGKTTTMNMLTGLTEPSEGCATLFGYDIQREALAAKRQLGIVPEISNIYDDLSAWDNLIFTAELYHVGRRERTEQATELLNLFDLFDRKAEKVKGFSKGMRRRITLAMGLMSNPRLLFLDEPTSGLDVHSTLIIKDVMKQLNKQGVTIFMTTHNIEEASVTCERVAIIHKGKIAAIDAPEKLKTTIESVQSIEVAFERTPSEIVHDLQNLPLISEVQKAGDKFRLYTDNPAGALSSLCEYASRNDLRLLSVNTFGPSLEDVFVRLTEIRATSGEK